MELDSLTLGGDLPSAQTADAFLLVGTSSLADPPFGVEPDYVIPPGFIGAGLADSILAIRGGGIFDDVQRLRELVPRSHYSGPLPLDSPGFLEKGLMGRSWELIESQRSAPRRSCT